MQPTTGDATTSPGTTGDSEDPGTGTESSGSSSGEPECGCVGQLYDIELEEPVGGYTAAERLALLPPSARLRWTAVSGNPETTITLTVTPELDNIRFGGGGDPCPLVIDPCLEGFRMFTFVELATDDGNLVATTDGRLSHEEASSFYPGIVLFAEATEKNLDPAFFEQVYQDEDGNPFVPFAAEIRVLVDPDTGELEEFSVRDSVTEEFLAELVPE
ncbi:MAG: hypothetical protein ACE37F_04930 [Nannocystaceae bacterium]|nr:hypothetical protein [bacterium]